MTKSRFYLLIFALLFCVSGLAVACGDLDDSDNTCDPEVDEDCECDDPDDLDTCFFVDDVIEEVTVNIQNFAFDPKAVTIEVGDSITWVNKDNTQHNLTNAEAGIDKNLNQNEMFTHLFNTAGTYTITNRLHDSPNLIGTITVEEATFVEEEE